MPAKGYFDDDRREYVLEDMFPLRPLKIFVERIDAAGTRSVRNGTVKGLYR